MCVLCRGYTSGDSLFTEIVWEKMRIMPTDPGALAAAAASLV